MQYDSLSFFMLFIFLLDSFTGGDTYLFSMGIVITLVYFDYIALYRLDKIMGMICLERAGDLLQAAKQLSIIY